MYSIMNFQLIDEDGWQGHAVDWDCARTYFQSWQSENQTTDAYIIHENADHPDNNDAHEEIEEEPLELVTRRPEPG